jgi:hypothetical protein
MAQARAPPVEAEGPVLLQDIGDEYGRAKEAGADQPVIDCQAWIEAGRPGPVLVAIEPQLLVGAVQVLHMNHQGILAVAGQHRASDAHGQEHELVLRAALLRTRPVK